MGIMAGLGPQWAKLYEKRKERNYKATERRQDWMDTYGIKGLNEMKDLASKSSIYLANLKGAGFTDEALQGLYADGDIEAIATMWSDVKKNNPSASDLAKIIAQAEELSTGESGNDLYSQIKEGLGLYKSGQSNDDIQENMFANALGYGGPRDPDGFEGYSYKDLRRISTGRTRRETGGIAANIRVPKSVDWDTDDAKGTRALFNSSVFPTIKSYNSVFNQFTTRAFLDSLEGSGKRQVAVDRAELLKITDESNNTYTIPSRMQGLTEIFSRPIYGGLQSPTLGNFFELIEDRITDNQKLKGVDNPADYFTFLPRTTRSAFNAWYKNKQSQ